jgi:hypothetical protein
LTVAAEDVTLDWVREPLRTGVGDFGGALRDVHAHELAAAEGAEHGDVGRRFTDPRRVDTQRCRASPAVIKAAGDGPQVDASRQQLGGRVVA